MVNNIKHGGIINPDRFIPLSEGEGDTSSIRMHGAITSFFLKIFGKVVDYQTDEGTVIHLNRNSLNKWMDAHGKKGIDLAKAINDVRAAASLKRQEDIKSETHSKLPEDLEGLIGDYLTIGELAGFAVSDEVLNKAIGGKRYAEKPALVDYNAPQVTPTATAQEIAHMKQVVVNALTFGKEDWLTYFGLEVKNAPPLPSDWIEQLLKPCPYTQGRMKGETHVLMLVPSITIRDFGKLIKARYPEEGDATGYRYIWDKIMTEYGDKPAGKAEWVLMLKEPVAGTENQPYTVQKEMVEAQEGYQVPTLLQAAASIRATHAKSQTRLYGNVYTRVQETTAYGENTYQAVVGGFAPGPGGGLRVHSDHFGGDVIRAGALWKFPDIGH